MSALHKNFIAGEWVAGAGVGRNVNPSDTSDVVGEYAQADAAQAAARSRRHRPLPCLVADHAAAALDILDAVGDEILARRDELAAFSPRGGQDAARGHRRSRRAPAQIFDFFAGEALRSRRESPSVRPGIDVEITREPVGVVGLITPWNFPIAIPAWKIAPALAYGNTVVFKPADLVPGCAWALADILARAGLPAGRLQSGHGARLGGRRGPARASATSTRSASPARSRPAARSPPPASRAWRKFQLEMGGKNPLVVLDDADLDDAVECAVQRRLLLDRPALHGVVAADRHRRASTTASSTALAERMKALVVDDALQAGHAISARWSTRASSTRTSHYIEIGRSEGAKLAFGGERLNARDARLLSRAGAVHRRDQRDAHRARGDLRPGRGVIRVKDYDEALAHRQRHAVRPLRGHLHDVAQTRVALQAQRRGRHGDGQPADRRRRLSRAVRRPQGLELRPARAGPLRGGVLHDGEDGLHGAVDEAAARDAQYIT